MNARKYDRQIAERRVDERLDFQSPVLRSALELWSAKAGGRKMPARRDFSIDDFEPYFRNVTIIEVRRDPTRYFFRMIGSEVADVMSRDLTGRFLDDAYDADSYRLVRHPLDWIVETGRPCRAHGNMVHDLKGHVEVEVLGAPLSASGETVDEIIKFTAFTFDFG